MPRNFTLSNPPIREAVIDIKVAPSVNLMPDIPQHLDQSVRGSYPKSAIRNKLGFQAELSQGTSVSITPQDSMLDAIVLQNMDEKILATFSRDGFGFSKLYPYTEWSSIKPQARQLWEEYTRLLHPNHIKRIAVRYINYIKIDSFNDIAGILRPKIYTVNNRFATTEIFTSRYGIKNNENTEFRANLLFSIETEGNNTFLVFDIDAFYWCKPSDGDDTIWQKLDELRDWKNSIFRNCLKPTYFRTLL